MITAADIRRTFLDFFARNGHTVVASSPLVPRNDPTLMFTNSGMVQFKNVFTARRPRPTPRHHGAAMRARRRQAQRSGECRLHRPAPHVLRDAGQLLLRRLFQAASDRVRLGADDRRLRAARRRSCWSPSMPRTTKPTASGRRSPACRTDRIIRIPTVGQFLAHGRYRPVRPVHARSSTTTAPRFPAARPARRTRTATGSSRSGTSSSCSSSR